jgi:hypothetical protein
MATGSEVLSMLIPTGGWVIYGDEFESIIYDEGVTSITKKQFQDGFAKVDAWKSEKEATKEATRSAILARLGITAEEAALLLG